MFLMAYLTIFFQVMNAEQFKLPDELNPHELLPYSWKWKDERQDLEQDSAFMKNCITCSKSSRGVPSVTCDFCHSVFHLDCLDPPLCEIPSVRLSCQKRLHFVNAKFHFKKIIILHYKIWCYYFIKYDFYRIEY